MKTKAASTDKLAYIPVNRVLPVLFPSCTGKAGKDTLFFSILYQEKMCVMEFRTGEVRNLIFRVCIHCFAEKKSIIAGPS
ncbi:MAG TPA: hypothetical protein H9931_00370 [Candidatus Enterocloster excrementigallinarum]|uniref:Uncharacterized protein n=1 Tax=Candidatus Enterocloster excrementigallinarum TaxID=2838558 RepID=A0A9D2PRP9_9FIRM|nr:hypothetical protein [Candidatus Enterocloster excrementigallinarum]